MLKVSLLATAFLTSASLAHAHDVDAFPEGTYEKVAAALVNENPAINVEMFSDQEVEKIFLAFEGDFEPSSSAAADTGS